MYISCMNVKFKFKRNDEGIPEQFKFPLFYIDKKQDSFLNEENDYIGYLENIERINFFVGANNSGKSRFLRGFFNTFNIKLECYSSTSVSNLINDIADHPIFNFRPRKANEEEAFYDEMKVLLDYIGGLKIYKKKGNFSSHDLLSDFVDEKKNFLNFLDVCKKKSKFFTEKNTQSLFLDFAVKVEQLIEELKFWHLNYCSFKKYIPPLRSLLMCDQLEKNSCW